MSHLVENFLRVVSLSAARFLYLARIFSPDIFMGAYRFSLIRDIRGHLSMSTCHFFIARES
jgi:hypothetical protein